MKKIYSNIFTPDRVFMRDLKRLDKRLGCEYRLDLGLFAITWEQAVGPPAELFLVRDDFGGFRHPDQRDIVMLCQGDLHRTDLKETLNRTEKYMKEFREKQEKFEEDEFKRETRENKIQLMDAYRKVFNLGGKPSAFRRIVPKPRGKTYDELSRCIAV